MERCTVNQQNTHEMKPVTMEIISLTSRSHSCSAAFPTASAFKICSCSGLKSAGFLTKRKHFQYLFCYQLASELNHCWAAINSVSYFHVTYSQGFLALKYSRSYSCMVVQRLAQASLCVEFACSPSACVGFLQAAQFLPTVH